jgi:hypothetical protein
MQPRAVAPSCGSPPWQEIFLSILSQEVPWALVLPSMAGKRTEKARTPRPYRLLKKDNQ